MPFDTKQLETRTQAFAVEAIRLVRQLRLPPELWDTGRQFVRAATSVGANHRAVSRSRSAAEFAAKLQIVYEEIDECCYWFEILVATLPAPAKVESLHREARELRAIFAKARATMRRRTG